MPYCQVYGCKRHTEHQCCSQHRKGNQGPIYEPKGLLQFLGPAALERLSEFHNIRGTEWRITLGDQRATLILGAPAILRTDNSLWYREKDHGKYRSITSNNYHYAFLTEDYRVELSFPLTLRTTTQINQIVLTANHFWTVDQDGHLIKYNMNSTENEIVATKVKWFILLPRSDNVCYINWTGSIVLDEKIIPNSAFDYVRIGPITYTYFELVTRTGVVKRWPYQRKPAATRGLIL